MKNALLAMIATPATSPSSPSMKLIAFITSTIAKMVMISPV